MSRIRLVQLIVAAATTALFAAGCGGSPKEPVQENDRPTTSGEPTPPDTPSPSETETGATDEEQGATREPLDDAAKAELERTVSSYLDALDQAYETGDTAEVKSLAHEKCNFCGSVAAYIDDVVEQGGRIENCQAEEPQDVTVGDELFVLPGDLRQVHYSATVTVTECVTYDSSGEVTDTDPAGDLSVQFTLEQSGDNWLIRTWEVQ